MKKKPLTSLLLALLSIGIISFGLKIPVVSAAHVVDGVISPGEYAGGMAVQLVGRWNPSWTVDAYITWDNTYLYVAVDEPVPGTGSLSWIEFAIDPNPGSTSGFLYAFVIFGTGSQGWDKNPKPSEDSWAGQGAGDFSVASVSATEFRVKYADYGIALGGTIKMSIDRNDGSSGPPPRDTYGYAAFWPQGAVVYDGHPEAQPATWGNVFLAQLNPTLYLDPALTEKTTNDIGTSFQVCAKITDFSDLQGFDIKITWGDTLITLLSVDYTTALNGIWGSGNWQVVIDQRGAGYYRLVAVSTAASFTGASPLPLCTLTFTVQDPQSSLPLQTAIHFDTHKFSDSQSNPITHTVTDGTYNISGTVPTIQMSPTSKTCRKYGETFTVQVSVSDAFDVTDFEFEIHYGTSLLDYSSIAWNAWGSGSINVDEANGVITGSSSGAMLSGNKLLVTIEFKAAYYHIWKDESKVPDWKNDQSGLIYIQSAKLSYPSGPDLSHVRGGSGNQINVDSDVTYTFSPIQGDVDNSGKVDIFDLRTVAAGYDKTSSDPEWTAGHYWSNYDFNGDGAIDVFDLVIVGSNFGFNYS